MRRRHFGELEQILLYAVLHLQDEDPGACGPTIRKIIEARTGRAISPGAIYTALDRLERRGFVRSELGDPTPERGGKRKRVYRMRAAGEAALRAAEAALEKMARLAREHG
ncbi:MAG: PadR family transcriptional regulator [Vicinamibacterales bacterium]